MARSGAGVYTLPAAYNPVVANTTILAAWGNTTLADVATALTDSLDRYGRGSMLSPLKSVAGTVLLPGLTFSSETTTGLSLPTAGQLSASVETNEVLRMTSSLISLLKDVSVTGAFDVTGAVGLTGDLTVDGDLTVTQDILLTQDITVTGNVILNNPLAVAYGGTAATTAAQALINIGERTGATGSVIMAAGTTAQRDGSPIFGYTRANSTLTRMEWWNGSVWANMGGGAVGGGLDATFLQVDDIATSDWTLGQDAMVSGVTVTIATPAVFTLANHGFAEEQHIRFTTDGALPTGLSVNQDYYIIATGLTTNTFQVSATRGGSAVNTSGAQSGTHSVGKIKSAIVAPSFVVKTGASVTVPTGADLISP